MELCIACSRSLDAADVPSYSEKADPPPTRFECGHQVCGPCVRKRRTLGQVRTARPLRGAKRVMLTSRSQSCILCSTALERILCSSTLSTGKAPSRTQTPGRLPSYDNVGQSEDVGGFVLGDDSDDEEQNLSTKTEPPPPAEEDWGAPPAYDGHGNAMEMGTDVKKEERVQPSIHYIRPEETLLGLSMKYGVDVRCCASYIDERRSLTPTLACGP